jgi:citrate synthase
VEQLRDLVDDVLTVDLALAAFAHAHGLRPDGGEFLFEFARIAGWVAHALEEYSAPALRFRVRGVYGA